MKIILSRKGFDSSCGGVPSPIFEDGTMFSLPIPGGGRSQRFSSYTTPKGSLGKVVHELSQAKIHPHNKTHLDPDLDAQLCPRQPNWLGSLGQVSAAQTHLHGQGVQQNDVFLFFGWFRPAQVVDGKCVYTPKSKAIHTLFGYLQIGEIIPLGATPNSTQLLHDRPWLEGHPHLYDTRRANNTLYIARPHLCLDGLDYPHLPGAAAFPRHDPALTLSAPSHPKSVWALPKWFTKSSLSYHTSAQRWVEQDDHVLLYSVAKGQEFVFDAHNIPEATQWLHDLVQTGLSLCPKQTKRPAP